ncbi:MAG: hypothetical protein IJE40_05665 [Clostridia bacterium]|nr:hypothetical protein [Clostridia bacterium]
MNKNVYLFEMDSVITSPEECGKAQEKLYSELMNGNVVVLSHNQILSIIMFDLLDVNQEKYTRDHILNLIKKKRICVSIYNGQETPGDYIAKKLEPGAEMFKFSCMRFLNGLKDDPIAFSEIKAAFEGKKAWRSWRDINISALKDDEKKLLHEYIGVMQELSHHLHAFKPITEGLHDLEYYLRMVISAVVSDGDNYLGFDSKELIKKAADNVEKMIDIVRGHGKALFRSACYDAIKEIKDSDKESLKLCKAIVDMSYNYQVERSISNITVTHPTDSRSVAKTVVEYYNKHNFTENVSIALPKETKVLAWEIVDDFSNEFKKVKDDNTDSLKPIKKFLFKAVVKTVLSVAIVVFFLFLGNYLESLMEWVGIFVKVLVIGVWLLSEYLNWIVPTSIYDGFASFIRLSRYFFAYSSFKKGQPYYVKVNLIERLREKFKREKDDD